MRELPTPTPDTPTLAELRDAFARLAPDTAPRWGRMTAPQMVRHCRVFVELCLGRVPVAAPVRWLARGLGPLFLRRLLARSPRAAPKNLTTLRPLRAADGERPDLDAERADLSARFAELERVEDPHAHPLYGRMRRADVIALVRHHTAHHACQFGLLDGG